MLDIGFGDPYSWLQSRDSSNYAVNYALALNPNGGNVSIGAISFPRKLTVQGADDGTLQIRMQGSADTTSYCEIGRESSSTGDFRINVSRSGTVINPLRISDTTGIATFISTVVAGTGQGFQNLSYQAGYNRIWSFGSGSEAYGMGYYQGATAPGGSDCIGMHFGSIANPFFYVNNNGIGKFTNYVTSKGVVIFGASGGYTTGDNTFINLGADAIPDSFGAINMPFGEAMKFNSYHGFQFKTSNSTASPVTVFTIAINGSSTFENSLNAVRFLNPGGPYGTGEANARNHFKQYNAGDAGLTGGWIAGAFGDALGDRIVIGQYQGVAVIAGHNANLTNWSNISLNTGGGNVLIGSISNATGKLQVTGTVYATGFYESSDVRFKNILETNPDINPSGIDVIKFNRIDNDIEQIRYGYSAQQVKSLLPDIVTGTEFLNVNYLDLHTLKIARLEKEVEELKAKLKLI